MNNTTISYTNAFRKHGRPVAEAYKMAKWFAKNRPADSNGHLTRPRFSPRFAIVLSGFWDTKVI